MKKLFFAAIAAGIALTACVTNEEEVSVGTDAKISFEAPLVQNARRVTGEIGTLYDTGESFVVSARFYEGLFSSWKNGSEYMINEKCSYNSGLKTWEPEMDYYWPKQGSLTFMAYSPADHTTWKPAINTEVSPEVLECNNVIISNGNRDMLYSELEKNETGNDNTGVNDYQGVDIKFHHALSSIKFKVCLVAALDNTTITLKAIQLKHVHQNGNFSWNLDKDILPTWTNTNTNKEYVITPVGGSNQVLTETPTYVADAQPCIMMPQTLSHGGTVGNVIAVITYTITNYNADGEQIGTPIVQTSEVDLSTLDYGTEQGVEWLPGKRYIYTVNAGLNRITFAPVVEDWKDQEVDYESTGGGKIVKD